MFGIDLEDPKQRQGEYKKKKVDDNVDGSLCRVKGVHIHATMVHVFHVPSSRHRSATEKMSLRYVRFSIHKLDLGRLAKKMAIVNAVMQPAIVQMTFARNTHGKPFCPEPILWYKANMLILTALELVN